MAIQFQQAPFRVDLLFLFRPPNVGGWGDVMSKPCAGQAHETNETASEIQNQSHHPKYSRRRSPHAAPHHQRRAACEHKLPQEPQVLDQLLAEDTVQADALEKALLGSEARLVGQEHLGERGTSPVQIAGTSCHRYHKHKFPSKIGQEEGGWDGECGQGKQQGCG